MNTATLFSTGKDDWGTPPALFTRMNDLYHFTLDVAANHSNHLCCAWYGPGSDLAEDALVVPWAGVCWMNPPYSKGLQHKFIAKAAREADAGRATTVALLPARTDTRSFHEHIWGNLGYRPLINREVLFLKGRVKFVGAAAGAPFPSMIVTFRSRG